MTVSQLIDALLKIRPDCVDVRINGTTEIRVVSFIRDEYGCPSVALDTTYDREKEEKLLTMLNGVQ